MKIEISKYDRIREKWTKAILNKRVISLQIEDVGYTKILSYKTLPDFFPKNIRYSKICIVRAHII